MSDFAPGTRVRITGIVQVGAEVEGRIPVSLDGSGRDAIAYISPHDLVDTSMPEDDPASGHDDWGAS